MNPRNVIPLLGLFAAACPVYDRGDCTSDRNACPEATTCDIRTGYCVRPVGEQAPDDELPGALDAGDLEQCPDAAAVARADADSVCDKSNADSGD